MRCARVVRSSTQAFLQRRPLPLPSLPCLTPAFSPPPTPTGRLRPFHAVSWQGCGVGSQRAVPEGGAAEAIESTPTHHGESTDRRELQSGGHRVPTRPTTHPHSHAPPTLPGLPVLRGPAGLAGLLGLDRLLPGRATGRGGEPSCLHQHGGRQRQQPRGQHTHQVRT